MHAKYLKDKLKCLQPLMSNLFNVFAGAVELFCDMGPLPLEYASHSFIFVVVSFVYYFNLVIEMSPSM